MQVSVMTLPSNGPPGMPLRVRTEPTLSPSLTSCVRIAAKEGLEGINLVNLINGSTASAGACTTREYFAVPCWRERVSVAVVVVVPLAPVAVVVVVVVGMVRVVKMVRMVGEDDNVTRSLLPARVG